MRNEFQSFSDEDLARQTQSGSLPAFDELIARYHRRIYAFVAQSCRNEADAAELAQETFVKAFQAIRSFNCERSFAPWLFTIARRNCIDHHRAAPQIAVPLPEMTDGRNPSEQLAQQEDNRTLWHLARRVLPDIQYQALWLKYAEDMGVESIAQVLHKTRTHVKVLLFRARSSLARELKSAEPAANRAPEPFTARPTAQPNTIHLVVNKNVL